MTLINSAHPICQLAYSRRRTRVRFLELALKTAFLARDHTVADDKREGHERHQQPEAVDGNGQADKPHTMLR